MAITEDNYLVYIHNIYTKIFEVYWSNMANIRQHYKFVTILS